MIFVSHQMPDVLAVCDRVAVLRLGELAATLGKDELTPENLVGYITGAKTGRAHEMMTAHGSRPGRPAPRGSGRVAAGPSVRDLWIGGVLLVLIIAFSIASPYFLTQANWLNTTSTATEVLLLAVGETFVICTGGIDLSVGAVLGFSGMVGAWVMAHWFAVTSGPDLLPVSVGFAAAVLAGGAFGAVNGVLVAAPRSRRWSSPWAPSASRPGWATCWTMARRSRTSPARSPRSATPTWAAGSRFRC